MTTTRSRPRRRSHSYLHLNFLLIRLTNTRRRLQRSVELVTHVEPSKTTLVLSRAFFFVCVGAFIVATIVQNLCYLVYTIYDVSSIGRTYQI